MCASVKIMTYQNAYLFTHGLRTQILLIHKMVSLSPLPAAHHHHCPITTSSFFAPHGPSGIQPDKAFP